MSERFAAIYLRVSSSSQDLRSQEPDLKRWAAAAALPTVVYREKASGSTMARPGWAKLWGDVVAGSVASVVVWRLDRLGRTASGLATLFDELRARRVDLVSLRDGITGLETASGRLMATILAGVAQYEREVRAERQTAGIAAAKAQGVAFGRPRGKGRAIKVTDGHRAWIERLKAEKHGVSTIAKLTGLSRQTIYTALKAKGSSS